MIIVLYLKNLLGIIPAVMTLQLASLTTIPTSFATCSIGCKDEHTLPRRLHAIASTGFTAIELSMPDILSFASLYLKHEVGPYDYDDLVTAAHVIKDMCDAKKLKVLMLQPFSNFEGWQKGSEERDDAFRRAKGWMRIMEAAGTDMLQVRPLVNIARPQSSRLDRWVHQTHQQRKSAQIEVAS
jgi:sugar phosphate isomerase/epimerase